MLGGEGSSHSLAVAWARKSSPRFLHTRRVEDGGERRPGIATDNYFTWWCTYFTDVLERHQNGCQLSRED